MSSRPFTRKVAISNGRSRYFLGGSDARIIVNPDEAALLQLWKEERGEADSKARRTSSRLRISAARRQSAARVPSLHPVSSVICWLLKLIVYFLHPGSRSRTPTPSPSSGTKINPAASIADRNFSPVLGRESRPVSNRLTVIPSPAAGARSAVLQSRAARTARHLIGITWQNHH
jgi:hypothetical protein